MIVLCQWWPIFLAQNGQTGTRIPEHQKLPTNVVWLPTPKAVFLCFSYSYIKEKLAFKYLSRNCFIPLLFAKFPLFATLWLLIILECLSNLWPQGLILDPVYTITHCHVTLLTRKKKRNLFQNVFKAWISIFFNSISAGSIMGLEILTYMVGPAVKLIIKSRHFFSQR